MSRLKQTEKAKQNISLISKVHYKMELYGYQPRDLLPILGISLSTWYNRLRHPEGFTLAELRAISQVLKIPLTDLFTVDQ